MRTRSARFGIVVVALTMITACGGSEGGSSGEASRPDTASPTIQIVALGDSDATGIGDASGGGWVERYGGLVKDKLGQPVSVDNRSAEGKTSEQLGKDVADDKSTRKALADADVILIGIGGADLNSGDDALASGACKGRDCYTQILKNFDANIAALVSEVRKLAPDAMLRAMSLPNAQPGAGKAIPSFITADVSRYQVETERASVCSALKASGGECVDVVQAFNGPDSNADAYKTGLMTTDPCCYPSGEGQQVIAELLLATGLPPTK